MKYWLVESKFITNKLLKVGGIVLYPFVFVDNKNNKKLVNHELIHIEQIKDCGVLKFYILYLYYWYKMDFDYYSIPFEVEAYLNESKMNYIETRRRKKWTF